MKQERVPIVFSIDENFVMQAAVAIRSLLSNGVKDQQCMIFILTDRQMKTEHQKVFHMLQAEYANCCIQIISMDNYSYLFLGVSLSVPRLTKATLYRLLLPEVLASYKHCIYLDADILILGDISELMSQDISEQYLAGVADREVQKMEGHADELEIPDLNEYVNGGVLLMNLELMRKDRKLEEFLSLVNRGYFYDDQDILNKTCYGKIELLPIEYNFFVAYEKRDVPVRILHFAGGRMDCPWSNDRARDGVIWWEYASPFRQYPVYQKVRRTAGARNFQYILDYCTRWQKIYIWGYTRYGRPLQNGLLCNGVKADGFIDNSADKQSAVYNGCKVYSPKDIAYDRETLVINAAQGSREIVNEFLLKKGFEGEQVLQYCIKTPEYYQYVGEDYFEDEFREYLLLEYGIYR